VSQEEDRADPLGSCLLIRSVLYGVPLGEAVRVSHAEISSRLSLNNTVKSDENPSSSLV
jgi:hypothetical protein